MSVGSRRIVRVLLAGMEWAAVSMAPTWCTVAKAATDPGPTMPSFAGPCSAAAQPQDLPVSLIQHGRPGTAAARRGRALGSGAGTCSVDGCPSDLGRCREYHRRHKVCEVHSKTPVVVVRGQEQRFCQQCSRFHMLPEFDNRKRSCRKRLDEHNRRRRKPQHEAMNPSHFFRYHRVNQFSVDSGTFPIADQSADVLMHPLDYQRPFSISLSETLKAPKHFLFLDDVSGILSTARPAVLLPSSSSENGTNTTNSSTCNGLSGRLNPECALSFLSSSLHLSPAIIPFAAAPAQFASSLTRIAAASQAAISSFAPDRTGAGDSVLVPYGMFEDPS